MKGYSAFPKAWYYWSLTIKLFSEIFRTFVWGEESYPSAEMQLVYSAAPADWAMLIREVLPLCKDAVGVKVKLSPFSRGQPEGSVFNSYYTEV